MVIDQHALTQFALDNWKLGAGAAAGWTARHLSDYLPQMTTAVFELVMKVPGARGFVRRNAPAIIAGIKVVEAQLEHEIAEEVAAPDEDAPRGAGGPVQQIPGIRDAVPVHVIDADSPAGAVLLAKLAAEKLPGSGTAVRDPKPTSEPPAAPPPV